MPGKFQITRIARDLPLPRYMTEAAAGMDLYAAVDTDTVLEPGRVTAVPTGIKISMPPDYEAQVRPRSGLALRGIAMPNAPGTIDADYRGEIKVLLINLGESAFTVERGTRIAQLVVNRIERVVFEEVGELEESGRGEGGFGHTGS